MSVYQQGYSRTMKTAGLEKVPGAVYREAMNILSSPVNVAGGVAREAFVPYAKKNPAKINNFMARPLGFLEEMTQNSPEFETIMRQSNPEQAEELFSLLKNKDVTPLLQSDPKALAANVGRLGILGGGTYAKSKLDEKYEDEGGAISHGKNVLKEKLMPGGTQ